MSKSPEKVFAKGNSSQNDITMLGSGYILKSVSDSYMPCWKTSLNTDFFFKCGRPYLAAISFSSIFELNVI